MAKLTFVGGVILYPYCHRRCLVSFRLLHSRQRYLLFLEFLVDGRRESGRELVAACLCLLLQLSGGRLRAETVVPTPRVGHDPAPDLAEVVHGVFV